MGQTNLFLIVFVIIITMIAVVAGMFAYQSHDRQNSFDRMTAESMRVASDVLLWKEKSIRMGGGLEAPTLSVLTLDQLGYPKYDADNQYGGNRYGYFGFDSVATTTPLMNYYSTDHPDLLVQVRFYGRRNNCFQIRRAINTEGDGTGEWAWVDLIQRPDACNGW
ncbi:MAG: hypothetical protein AAF809_06010 [Bacteroidota bacterium]